MRTLAVLLVSVALLVGIGVWLLPRSARRVEERPVQAAPATDATRIPGAFEARLERLEERVREAELAVPSVPPRELIDTGQRDELEELARRVEDLDRRLSALEPILRNPAREPTANELARIFAETHADPVEGERPTAEEEAADRERRMTAAEYAILDPAATVAEVIAAHESLRRVEDAYTPEMVAVLMELGDTYADPEVRADVWRIFDGSTHLPELVPSLLRALGDADFRVRREAAETLGNYADDPLVLAALRRIARSDPSPEVRERALRTARGI